MTRANDETLLALLDEDGHVRFELHWLLTSAIEFTNRYDSGALTVVLQDSALMHGRTLLEFACKRENDRCVRLSDFMADGITARRGNVPWRLWIEFMNSQTSHLSRKRNPGVRWPHDMMHTSADRMRRLADDVLRVFEANLGGVRPGRISERFAEVVTWGRGHLARLEPPSPILPDLRRHRTA